MQNATIAMESVHALAWLASKEIHMQAVEENVNLIKTVLHLWPVLDSSAVILAQEHVVQELSV